LASDLALGTEFASHFWPFVGTTPSGNRKVKREVWEQRRLRLKCGKHFIRLLILLPLAFRMQSH